MKRFFKWIAKNAMWASICFLVCLPLGMLARWYFFDRGEDLPSADKFAQDFMRGLLQKDYVAYREMMHDNSGEMTMQSYEEEISQSWSMLQTAIDEGLFAGRKRSNTRIYEIVSSARCNDVVVHNGYVASVFDFESGWIRVLVGNTGDRLSVVEVYVDSGTQYELGQKYYYGRGVTQDYKEAVKWYRKSAEQGSAYGQCDLGYMYDKGLGIAQDYKEAVKWYRKSAEQGNALGQNNLGVMYDCGRGVTQDYKEAVKWFRKSAEQGNAAGQCDLGVMYEYGKGVSKDINEAIRLYRLAAAQGNENAKKALERLNAK